MSDLILPKIDKRSKLKEAFKRSLKEEVLPNFSNSYDLPSLRTEATNNELLRSKGSEKTRAVFKAQTKSKKTQFPSNLRRLSIDCLDVVFIPTTDDFALELASAREQISKLERELEEKNATIANLHTSAQQKLSRKSKNALAKSALKNSIKQGESFLHDFEKIMALRQNLNKNKFGCRETWLRRGKYQKHRNLSMQV